jgi:sporulation domain protein|nr:hypothetical protein [uncultured Capnocytophaga sp.]
MSNVRKLMLCLLGGLFFQALTASKVNAQIISGSTEETIQTILNQRILLVEDKISSDEIPEGYYVIAGVYKNTQGALQMKNSINNLGIKAEMFTHPNNNMSYIYIDKVYLSRGDAGKKILALLRRPEFFNSKLWVLKVG